MFGKAKFSKIGLAIAMIVNVLFFAVGCGGSTAISGIHMSSDEIITVPYGNFDYEGIKVTVDFESGETTEINLTSDMISKVEQLKFYKMGEQEIKVVFRDKYETTMKVNVILNQFNSVYELVGYECTYDGLPHSVSLNHELPEGATVVYPYGNTFVNAGTYDVTAILSKNGYESKTLKTTLVINQAQRDASAIVFEDTTLVYTGDVQTIEAKNVPEGVEVTYDTYNVASGIRINKVVNAGQYRVVAHFNDTSTNYAKIPDKEAILTIQKASYDVSDIYVEDYVKEYDALEYQARLVNGNKLPSNIKVSFRYLNESGIRVNSNANVGVYTIVAEFTGMELNNYNSIEPMYGKLTVSQKVIKISDKVTFESKTVNFDENETHFLEVSGLPSNVSVTYENNGQKFAGEYMVKAKFAATNPYETVDVSEMVSYLIINKVRRSVMVYDQVSGEYTKTFSEENISIVNGEAVVSGYQTDVFVLDSITFYDISDNQIVDPADFVDGTTYNYAVQFSYVDEEINSSVLLSNIAGSFTYTVAQGNK